MVHGGTPRCDESGVDEQVTAFVRQKVDAAEEAIINALCAATTTTGRDGTILYALPVERLSATLRTYGQLVP